MFHGGLLLEVLCVLRMKDEGACDGGGGSGSAEGSGSGANAPAARDCWCCRWSNIASGSIDAIAAGNCSGMGESSVGSNGADDAAAAAGGGERDSVSAIKGSSSSSSVASGLRELRCESRLLDPEQAALAAAAAACLR
jgi:hypothetical protein